MFDIWRQSCLWFLPRAAPQFLPFVDSKALHRLHWFAEAAAPVFNTKYLCAQLYIFSLSALPRWWWPCQVLNKGTRSSKALLDMDFLNPFIFILAKGLGIANSWVADTSNFAHSAALHNDSRVTSSLRVKQTKVFWRTMSSSTQGLLELNFSTIIRMYHHMLLLCFERLKLD